MRREANLLYGHFEIVVSTSMAYSGMKSQTPNAQPICLAALTFASQIFSSQDLGHAVVVFIFTSSAHWTLKRHKELNRTLGNRIITVGHSTNLTLTSFQFHTMMGKVNQFLSMKGQQGLALYIFVNYLYHPTAITIRFPTPLPNPMPIPEVHLL